MLSRRAFLKILGYGAGACLSGRAGAALESVPVDVAAVRHRLANQLETAPRERILEEVFEEIQRGLGYDDLFAALAEAAVHALQPFPDVGFKYHGVMMLQSLHLTALSSAGTEKWLPLVWGVDDFKRSQMREKTQTGWRMPSMRTVSIDAAGARRNLLAALENWDREASESAVTQLSQTATPYYSMSLLLPFFARDYRALGHKPITGANAHRLLYVMKGHAADAILRSAVAAIANHTGETNPARSDHPSDRAWRHNMRLIKEWNPPWHPVTPDRETVASFLDVMRHATDLDASREAAHRLTAGIGTHAVWEALFITAGEMMLRTGSFVALHANTMINALHYLYLQAADNVTRNLLLLQSVALLARFRSDIGAARHDVKLDELEALDAADPEEIFTAMERDRLTAARLALGYLNSGGDSEALLKRIRHYTVHRASDPHDYKYAEAVIENFHWLTTPLRNHYLSSAMLSLNGPHHRVNPVVENARARLSG